MSVRDIAVLDSPKERLNDEIVNFYFNILQQRAKSLGRRMLLYNSFFCEALRNGGIYKYQNVARWTKLAKLRKLVGVGTIFELEKCIVPIFDRAGEHYMLVEIIFEDRKINLYDPLTSGSDTAKDELFRCIRRYLIDEQTSKCVGGSTYEWTCETVDDLPRQKNNIDCRVFICRYASCLVAGRPFEFGQEDITST